MHIKLEWPDMFGKPGRKAIGYDEKSIIKINADDYWRHTFDFMIAISEDVIKGIQKGVR